MLLASSEVWVSYSVPHVTVFAGCCVRGAFTDKVLGEYLCESCCVSSGQSSFLIEVSLDPNGLSGKC